MRIETLRGAIRRFYFPPEGSPLWIGLLPYATLDVLSLAALVSGAYAWDYTNSPPFCGAVCHTMPPEYTACLTSHHARVDCVECHIGRGFIATRVTRKAGDTKYIVALAFHEYEFPIRATDLRPARETCERCHFPEKFSDDSLRHIQHYANGVDNTPTTTYLVLKTGGGSKRQGLGRGIHWHIENQVHYLPLDPEEQSIPYVRVIQDDGSVSEYVELGSGIDPASINPSDLKEMDCITCHNRVTHLILSPEDTVDQLITGSAISQEIPELHEKACRGVRRVIQLDPGGHVRHRRPDIRWCHWLAVPEPLCRVPWRVSNHGPRPDVLRHGHGRKQERAGDRAR